MKYQFVIQFSEENYSDIDWIANIEDKLDECLVNAEVDGHDIGSGEVNIFIHTDTPVDTFEVVKKTLQKNSILVDAKIAYSEIDKDNFVCLWPKGLTEFSVL